MLQDSIWAGCSPSKRCYVRIVSPGKDPRSLHEFWKHVRVAQPANFAGFRSPCSNGIAGKTMDCNDTKYCKCIRNWGNLGIWRLTQRPLVPLEVYRVLLGRRTGVVPSSSGWRSDRYTDFFLEKSQSLYVGTQAHYASDEVALLSDRSMEQLRHVFFPLGWLYRGSSTTKIMCIWMSARLELLDLETFSGLHDSSSIVSALTNHDLRCISETIGKKENTLVC